MVPVRESVGLIATFMLLSCWVADSQAQVRVRAVDLYGTAISGVQVQLKDSNGAIYASTQPTNENGVATVDVNPVDNDGYATIEINMEGETNRDSQYIGRIKEVEWANRNEFTEGFAVPLWEPGDVSDLADAVIRNPSHIAVAVQLGDNYGSRSRVIAAFDKDVDWWLATSLAELPMIVDPPLARALHAQTQPGQTIPPHFDAAMRNVFDEVQRQNEAARVCRMFPQGQPQPPQQNPPQQNPPQQNPPQQNPPQQNPPQQNPLPAFPPRQDPPRVDPPQIDPPQIDPPRVDPPHIDPPLVYPPPKYDPPMVCPPPLPPVPPPTCPPCVVLAPPVVEACPVPMPAKKRCCLFDLSCKKPYAYPAMKPVVPIQVYKPVLLPVQVQAVQKQPACPQPVQVIPQQVQLQRVPIVPVLVAPQHGYGY